jgi:cell wall assembly regulator SMI1
MEQDLEKIENWFKWHAQRIFNHSLQKPATEIQFDELEKTIGKSLPADFKALYLWHNGLDDEENFGSLFYGMDLFPVNRIIEQYLYKKDSDASKSTPLQKADKEIDPDNIDNIDWIKFAFDGSLTGLFIDLSPSSNGNYGQIIL